MDCPPGIAPGLWNTMEPGMRQLLAQTLPQGYNPDAPNGVPPAGPSGERNSSPEPDFPTINGIVGGQAVDTRYVNILKGGNGAYTH